MAPVPAPTEPSSTTPSVACSHAAYPESAVGRAPGSPAPRSNRTAPATIGTRASPVSNPTSCSSSQRSTPFAAARPNALPPVNRNACAPGINVPGRSESVPSVPGAPPRTSAAATEPSGHRIDRAAGMPDGIGPVAHAHALDVGDHVASFFVARSGCRRCLRGLRGDRLAPGLRTAVRRRFRGREALPGEHADVVVHLCRSLEHRHVSRVLDHDERGVGQDADQLDGRRRRRHPVVLADDHDRRNADPRQRVAEVHLHQPCEAVRPHLRPRASGEAHDVIDQVRLCLRAELGHPREHPADVGGAREHRAPEPVHAPRRGRERSEPRTHELRDRAHRPAEQVGGRRTDQRHAGHPRAEQLRPLLGHREDRHGAHAVSHHHGRTVGRHRIQHGGDVTTHRAHRQVSVRRVAARPVRPMVHQHAAEVVGQIDPLLVPDGHVEAESVREQQHRSVRIPGRPDGDLGPVERHDGIERLRGQVADRLRAVGGTVTASRQDAHRGAGDDRAGRDGSRDRGGAFPAHRATCSRGTRAPIRVTIS